MGRNSGLLRWSGARVGHNVFISTDVWIDPAFPQLLTIQDDVMVGVGVKIALHEFGPRQFRAGRVTIGKGAVIGGFALIGPGLEIGEDAVVAALGGLLVLALAAGLLFRNAIPFRPSPTGTSTPSPLATDTLPVPSNTTAWTDIPISTIFLGRTGVLQFEDGSAVADRAVLVADALLAPPSGSQYEVWLVGGDQRISLGILTLDGNGRGILTFNDEQALNLIARYSGVEVTIEPASDTDPKSSGIVAYSFYHAQDGLTHLRTLLASSPNTPGQTALIQGLNTNIQTIDELAREMQKASVNGNVDRVRLNAEAILNTLLGSQSPSYRDWNNDGQADDPSDGYGLLLNGRNLGYLRDAYLEADAAARAVGVSEQLITHGTGVKNSVQNLAQWTEQLETVTTAILASPPPGPPRPRTRWRSCRGPTCCPGPRGQPAYRGGPRRSTSQ